MFRKVGQSCSPKRFPEAACQNSSPKHLCKAIAPKRLCLKTFPILQSGFPKTILQSGSRNSKTAAESCSPKLRPKAKLVPKAAPQSCGSLELLLKAAVRSCRAKLLLKAAPAPQSCSPNRFSATPKNTATKRLPQSCYASNVFPQIAPLQSGSRKLLRKVAAESCSPCKISIQNCSCSPNLLHKAVPKSRSPKGTPNICSPKLLKLPS